MLQSTKQKYDLQLINIKNDVCSAMIDPMCKDPVGWQELFDRYKEVLGLLMEERGGTVAISNAIQSLRGRVDRKLTGNTDEPSESVNYQPADTSKIFSQHVPLALVSEEDIPNGDYQDRMKELEEAMKLIMGVYSWAVKKNPITAEVDAIRGLQRVAESLRAAHQSFAKVGHRV